MFQTSPTVVQKPIREQKIQEEEEEERESPEEREEVSSLFHIKERDFGSLRERHRRLRERMRQRAEREKTTTTTTKKPKRTRVEVEDDRFSSSNSRGSLLFRNRQETLSKEREREALIAKLNQNRFETVDPRESSSVNARRPPQSREPELEEDLSEKEELLEKLRNFEREKEELIRRLNKLESGVGGGLSGGGSKFRERERERTTTQKPRKRLEPIVCRENNELHANPQSCRKYFKCENGLPSLQSCPANLIFDATINVCNWPDSTECVEDPDAILPQLGSSDVHPPSASIFRRPSRPSFSDDGDDGFQRAPPPPPPPPEPQGRVPTLAEALEREEILTNEYPQFRSVPLHLLHQQPPLISISVQESVGDREDAGQ